MTPFSYDHHEVPPRQGDELPEYRILCEWIIIILVLWKVHTLQENGASHISARIDTGARFKSVCEAILGIGTLIDAIAALEAKETGKFRSTARVPCGGDIQLLEGLDEPADLMVVKVPCEVGVQGEVNGKC